MNHIPAHIQPCNEFSLMCSVQMCLRGISKLKLICLMSWRGGAVMLQQKFIVWCGNH